MKIPKEGSKWTGNDGERFHVVSTIELEGHTWVYYVRENAKSEPKEYSCYVESFLNRFRELPE